MGQPFARRESVTSTKSYERETGVPGGPIQSECSRRGVTTCIIYDCRLILEELCLRSGDRFM
ncbi:hypothetical protein X777_11855 [Ooceraea biroi]|uniref:Uncharacterized protein n=1 Tax=Ooceraea biroi TaxID=2015173 RepID=A0A026W2U9_OOCBI|nr:hypothetical protein X777_11855 [Ooceraea biroi]